MEEVGMLVVLVLCLILALSSVLQSSVRLSPHMILAVRVSYHGHRLSTAV